MAESLPLHCCSSAKAVRSLKRFKLLCVISGLLAGGSPGFRTMLCWFCPHRFWVLWQSRDVVLWFIFISPYQYQGWCNAITFSTVLTLQQLAAQLDSLAFLLCWFCLCVFLVVFCCCCLGAVLCCFFALSWSGTLMAYAGSYLNSVFCNPLFRGWWYLIYELVNLQHAIQRVERPGESEEASDGKKLERPEILCHYPCQPWRENLWAEKGINGLRMTTQQDLAKVSSKTIHSAAPKPRIPPARIPEIALRSPPGMRHLRNEGQLCNELESNTSVGTLPCEAPRQI